MSALMRSAVRLAATSRVAALSVAHGIRHESQMSFTFASPGDVFYNNASIKQVDVPSFSGDFGILPNHVPILSVLKPGVITVHEDDGSTNKFFASSGSITVNDDSSVQILAEEAVRVEDLDPQAIRDGANKAGGATSATDEKAKAEAQIEVDCYEALQKAVS